MRCSQCEQHLSALLDGELPRDLVLEVERHVAGCERCAAHRVRLERLGTVLEAAPELEPSTGFDAAFTRRLQDARRAARIAGSPAPRRRRWLWPAFAAVAAGACAALVAVVLSRAPDRPPASPDPGAIVLARNLDLLRSPDYDVVRNLDALEDADVVLSLDELLAQEEVQP